MRRRLAIAGLPLVLWAAQLNAARHWGPVTACPGGVSVQRQALPPGVLGRAVFPCLVELDRGTHWDRSWGLSCTVVAHEWGHLLGRGHEPSGVMAAYPQPDRRTCPPSRWWPW